MPILAGAMGFAAAPNIVYVMADDLGYGDLGCYGQARIPTPHLDALATDGVRLTRFYAPSPVCAPTRCSFLTGQHQGHAAIRGNKEAGDSSLNAKEGQYPLPRDETTLAELLRGAGYRTGMIGKWGLGGPEPGETPMDHGFDEFYGYLCQRRSHNHHPAYLWRNHQPEILAGNRPFVAHQRIGGPLSTDQEYLDRFTGKDYAPALMLEECRRFIRANRTRPFFLYYAPTLPHVSLQVPAEWIDRFPRGWDSEPYLGQSGYLPTSRPRATYAAMVAYLDHTVGEVRKSLAEAGVADNTLIVFTSDNGAAVEGGADFRHFESNGPLREGKRSLYEGGIRVPFLAAWPGRIPAGSTSHSPAAGYDSLATLCAAAGVKPPKTDGLSFLPSLLGRPFRPREAHYFEFAEGPGQQAVIFGRFKAIRPNLAKEPEKIEVYDLEQDPGETKDVADAQPDLVKKAQDLMRREHRPNKVFPLTNVD